MRAVVRAAGYVALPVLVATAASVLPYTAGRDPARSVLRARAVEADADRAALDAVRRELDLPACPVDAATGWLAGLLRGDLGTSWVSGEPVARLLPAAAGASLTLTAAALVVGTVTAASLTRLAQHDPLGRFGGAGEWGTDSGPGRAARLAATALAAVPELVLAAACVWVAALGTGWPDTSGWSGPADLVLPAVALGLPLGGVLAVVMQRATQESLEQPWVRTWAAAGHPDGVVARAGMRSGFAELVPLLGLVLGGVLGSAVLVETVFGIPGLGRLALGGVLGGDLPVVQATLLVLLSAGLAAGVAARALGRRVRPDASSTTGVRVPAEGARPAGGAAWALLALLLVTGLPRDPGTVALERRHAPPSTSLPLGADHLGRDLLARVAHGLVVTVGPALLVAALSLTVALLVSYRGSGGAAVGLVGNAIPPAVLGLLTATALGPSAGAAVLALALVAWVPLATHARTLVGEVRAREHVSAAVALGLRPWRVHRTEVLPAVLPALLRHAAARVAHLCVGLTGLTFLGLGAQPPSPSWGLLVDDGLTHVAAAPLGVLAPVTALVLVGLAVAQPQAPWLGVRALAAAVAPRDRPGSTAGARVATGPAVTR